MTDDAKTVINLLGFGRKNALSRATLAALTNMTDRKVRRAIESARRDGLIIISAEDGSGYYFSNDLDEIERQYRIDHARAMALLYRLKTMRKILRKAGRV